MIQPKAVSYHFMGSQHKKNDDVVLLNQEQGIYIVCDGVSEGGNGDFAARIASNALQEALCAGNVFKQKNGANLLGVKRLQYMQDQMISACDDAQEAIQDAVNDDPELKNASCTGLALWLDGRFAILSHIGDSRAYLYRSGKLYLLTQDHSGVYELIKMGMSPELAAKSPQAKSLSRTYGGPKMSHPDLFKIEFQPNDLFFMCTDGVYSALDAQGLQQLAEEMLNKQDVKTMIQRCSHQSGDDSTLVQIHFPAEMLKMSPLLAADRIKLIQDAPLSKYFDFVQKSHIAAICEIEQFKAGSIIIQEGTEGDSLYIVASGTLEVQIKGQHIKYMKVGDFLGEIALIQRSKRTATVIAKEDVVLLSLNRDDLNNVFKRDPKIELNFYKSMMETVLARVVELGNENAQLKKV